MRGSEFNGSGKGGERILVTGANGFLGAHLAEYLSGQGHSLTLAVRSPESCWRGYVPTLPPSADVRWAFVGNIGADTDWRAALQDVSTVVHLAGRAHVRHRTDEESAHRRMTVDASVGLARAATVSDIRRFYYVSSIGAVTNGTGRLVGASTPPEPRTVYGQAKLAAEAAVTVVSASAGMNTVIIRPPLLYGPGQPGNMARLFGLVRRGLPLPFGRVRNRRSFLYVRNFTDLIGHLMKSPRQPAVVVPADREHWSTPELIRAIAAGYGYSARLLPVPEFLLRQAVRLRPFQGLGPLVDSLAVDVTSLAEETGWTAPYAGAEALVRTAQAADSAVTLIPVIPS